MHLAYKGNKNIWIWSKQLNYLLKQVNVELAEKNVYIAMEWAKWLFPMRTRTLWNIIN